MTTEHTPRGCFGVGFAAAWNDIFGVSEIMITTNVAEQPAVIMMKAGDRTGIPSWWVEPLTQPVSGLEISYRFPVEHEVKVRESLEELLDKTLLPIRFNGRVYQFNLDKFKGPNDILVTLEGEPSVVYLLRAERQSYWGGNEEKNLWIHVRGMLVEEDCSHVSLLGLPVRGNLPQNYSVPYAADELIIVKTQTAGLVVGRDKLLRDDHFESIKDHVLQARARALAEAIGKRPARLSSGPWCGDYIKDMVLGNLRALRSELIRYLKGEAATRPYYTPLLARIANYPIFHVFASRRLLTLREIVEAEPPAGVYAWAESKDDILLSPGRYLGPFILRQEHFLFERIFGGHHLTLIESLLEPIITGLGRKMLQLGERLNFDEAKVTELVQKGILEVESVSLAAAQVPENAVAFLDSLKQLMNRKWLREALRGHYRLSRIHLQAVGIASGNPFNFIAAVVKKPGQHRDELHIGINFQSTVMRKLISDPVDGAFAFLPILCHELSHRPAYGIEMEQVQPPHGFGFYLTKYRLDERVLDGAISWLVEGSKAEDSDFQVQDEEWVVLD